MRSTEINAFSDITSFDTFIEYHMKTDGQYSAIKHEVISSYNKLSII